VPTPGHVVDQPSEAEAIFRRIFEGVAANVGEQFFPSLVQQLAISLGVDYTYISELSGDGSRFRSKPAWANGGPFPPFDVSAKGLNKVDMAKALILRDMERQHIRDILEQTSWRVSGEKGAAKILGLNPTTLEARMKKLDIARPSSPTG
jgi:DNA-binding NtrC family response regulator